MITKKSRKFVMEALAVAAKFRGIGEFADRVANIEPPKGNAVKRVTVLKNGHWRVQLTRAWASWVNRITRGTGITPPRIILECLRLWATKHAVKA